MAFTNSTDKEKRIEQLKEVKRELNQKFFNSRVLAKIT
jgi:hypothetical protein